MAPMSHSLLRPKAGYMVVAPEPEVSPPTNAGPTAVSFANVTASLAEDADTSSAIHLADIVVTDDGVGTNTLSISGDSRFLLTGNSLYLAAGSSVDYETATSHSTTVTATDDSGAGSAQATFVLTIQNVPEGGPPDAPTGVAVTVVDNEGPTGITLSNQTTSLAEDADTTSRIHLADITLADDGMGTNTVTVDNPSYFEIYQGNLYLVAVASLDYETATSHSCTISAVDSTTNDAAVTQAFTLTVTDVLELSPPDSPSGVAVAVSEDSDPFFSSTVLLLQDSFSDQSLSGQTIAISGNATPSTTQVKVGTHSLAFDGSGDWATVASTAIAFGTGPFTVEFWMYWDGTVTGTPWMAVMGAHNSSGSNTGRYGIFMNNGGLSHFIQTAFPSTAPISANTWHHIASTRDSAGSCRLFVDGILKSTVTDAGNLVFPQGFRVGNDFQPNRPPFSGYLDSVRVTKGVCRYISNFTPNTTEFPN